MANLLTALIVAFWVCAIALIAVQNAAPITLRLLAFQTIPIPMGVVLAFCVALGVVGMAIVLPLGQTAPRSSRFLDEE